MLEHVKVAVSLLSLLAASYFDYKNREVPDVVWAMFAPSALSLTVIEVYLSNFSFSLIRGILLSASISAGAFITIFYLGFYGGADAKALISLSLAVPLPPSQLVSPMLGYVVPLFPVSILNNTLALAVLTLPYAPISNLLWRIKNKSPLFAGLESEPILKKVAACVFCVKKGKSKIKPYHSIAETVTVAPDGEVSRKISIAWRVEEARSEVDYEALPPDVFVSFSLPMLLFITLGFVTALFLGDVVVWLVSRVLSIG